MNSQKRRGGKPNRGGGRGRGGGGPPRRPAQPPVPNGAISRKGAGKDYEEDDLYDPDEESFEESSDDEWIMEDEGDEDYPIAKTAPKDPNKPLERRKVEIQILHMSDQSQQMVIQMLKEIYGSQYKMRDASSYIDDGQRMDKRFWIQDRLKVTNIMNFSAPQENEKPVEDQVMEFALKKMESYGFHKSRCQKALVKANHDVGNAFEDLMTELFELVYDVPQDIPEDIEDQKEDEKLAIQSIYGDSALVEKIPGKLWELKLENLSLIETMLPSTMKKPPRNPNVVTREMLEKDPSVCQWYLRPKGCKFGKKCFKKHVNPDKDHVGVDDKHLKDLDADEKVVILEIRFPDGCKYPIHPPLVSFNTPMKKISRQDCLKVTSRLMEEAKSMAQDHVPSVFSLIGILENNEEIRAALAKQDVSFSFAIGLEPGSSASGQVMSKQDKLFSSLGVNSKQSSSGSSRKNDQASGKRQPRNMRFDNEKIIERFKKKVPNKTMFATRKGLPAWNEQENILKALDNHQVLVVSGMTGCGKSTQVPQYILDSSLSIGQVPVIICTQPRRISAIGVAERVAQERDEKAGNLIGYQIRLESKTSSMTRLLFCTTGILLRRLESDPELNEVTHLVVDEVHERSMESDFLLMIIRDLLPRRPKLKIILMSATLNADAFGDYFKFKVPIIDIPGRTFPVQQYYLEEILEVINFSIDEYSPYAKKRQKEENKGAAKRINKMLPKDVFIDDFEAELLVSDTNFKVPKDKEIDDDLNAKQMYHRYSGQSEHCKRALSLMDFDKINYNLIESTIEHILESDEYPQQGSILVFLPGLQEIMTLHDQIAKHPLISRHCRLLPLHSSLTSEEQSLIFSKMSKRKIVISTNLAETSITIDDCVFVIEVGKMKEKRFDPSKNMESLDTIWVSKANALQRKGRAGRVMSGFCFHLYTNFRFEQHLRKYPIPEIQRVPLEQMLLRIKIMPLFHNKRYVSEVLRNLIEPPESENVKSSLARLRGVGAIDENESLTPLGYHLASLPVDVRIGKLLIFGAVFKCLDSALTIAACMSGKSPFVSPFGKREEAKRKRKEFSAWGSDQITDLQGYNAWREKQKISYAAGYAFTQENYLSIRTMQTIVSMKHQFAELLSSIGFIPEEITSRRLDKSGRNGTDAIEILINPELNINNKSGKLLVSLLCASLYPNVVQILSPKQKFAQTSVGAMAKVASIDELRFRTKYDGYVNIHPSSVVARSDKAMECSYIVFREKIKTSRVFVRECSLVPIYSMVLFGGFGIDVELQRGQFVLSMEDGWIKFVTFSHVIAECLKEMRRELDKLLEEKIAKPDLDLTKNVKGKLIIDTIVNLIQKE